MSWIICRGEFDFHLLDVHLVFRGMMSSLLCCIRTDDKQSKRTHHISKRDRRRPRNGIASIRGGGPYESRGNGYYGRGGSCTDPFTKQVRIDRRMSCSDSLTKQAPLSPRILHHDLIFLSFPCALQVP